MSRWRWLVLAPWLVALPPFGDAAAARRVEWTSVDVRDGPSIDLRDAAEAKRISRALRDLLVRASKKTRWGGRGPLRLSARVTELAWEADGDVLRLRLTVVARIEGGESVRSHIRMGSAPSERRKLEQQALRVVADGVVIRLAAIARARAGGGGRMGLQTGRRPASS